MHSSLSLRRVCEKRGRSDARLDLVRLDREFTLVGPRDLLVRRSAVKRVLVAVVLLASVAHVVRHLDAGPKLLEVSSLVLHREIPHVLATCVNRDVVPVVASAVEAMHVVVRERRLVSLVRMRDLSVTQECSNRDKERCKHLHCATITLDSYLSQ